MKKERVHKDLLFLLGLSWEQATGAHRKYVLEEGNGPLLREIEEPFIPHCTYSQYDYAGKFLMSEGMKVGGDNELHEVVMGMREEETGWINATEEQRHYELRVEWLEYKNA